MEGGAATIVSAGFTTHIALDAARMLEDEDIDTAIKEYSNLISSKKLLIHKLNKN